MKKDNSYDLPPEASERIIYHKSDCDIVAETENKPDLMKKVIEYAMEVHGLEDRRLAPAVFMERVEKHNMEE